MRRYGDMKITFVSNFLGPHQLPFCEEMYKRIGDDFKFVETEPMSDERIKLGWALEKSQYPFEIKAYESIENDLWTKSLILSSDVVIIGSAPDSYIVSRLRAGKLTFKYSERFYKTGLNLKKIPHAMIGAWLHHGRFQKYPLYMLCASAYTPADAAVFHNYIGRTYKWGYFPKAKEYDAVELMKKKLSVTSGGWKHPQASILWAGRLIGWKHPDASIELAASLKKKGYSFRMSIIGNGELETQLRDMIRDRHLEDCVEMLGAMSPDEVRDHMEKADIYLFTSDFNEGWGAVLNESMNSGCAVVASHAIGSVPFLIKNGENGLIYENENQKHLEEQVIRLLDDAELRSRIGKKAYETIVNMWNAKTAAERFILLAQNLIEKNNTDNLFTDGPCSKAKIIKNNWYQRK